jgi:hypothetical protein
LKNCSWEPLIYLLLFPHMILGWGIYGTQNDFSLNGGKLGNPFEWGAKPHRGGGDLNSNDKEGKTGKT